MKYVYAVTSEHNGVHSIYSCYATAEEFIARSNMLVGYDQHWRIDTFWVLDVLG